MNWKSFLEHLPKKDERILIIHEWLGFDFESHDIKRCYTIYECNFKNIIENVVILVNGERIIGESRSIFEKKQYINIDAKELHWARLD